MKSDHQLLATISWLRQKSSVNVKSSRYKFDEKQDIYMASKYFPTNYLLVTKRKIVNFTLETPGQLCCSWQSKWLPVMGQTSLTCFPTQSGEDAPYLFCALRPRRMHNIVITKQANPDWGAFYKINGWYSSKISVSQKTQKSWETTPD